jgi:hypothetical protein
LFNNFSQFCIEWIDDWYQGRKLSKQRLSLRGWRTRSYMPHVCLADGGAGPASLLASNARVKLGRATCFVQFSLTDYFRGIHLLDQAPDKAAGHQSVYFVTRRFDDNSLRLPDGQSVFSSLCSLGDLIVIEDVDCTARTLRRHLEVFQLADLAAADATDRKKMQGTNILCVTRRENERFLPGRRIW